MADNRKLIAAIFEHDLDKVEEIIGRDNDNVDAIYPLFDNKSALHIAVLAYVTEEDEKIIEYLLDNGANVNLIDNAGETALFYAIRNNLHRNNFVPRYVEEIIRSIDVNSLNKITIHGESILKMACHYHKTNNELIRLLLDYGAKDGRVDHPIVNYYKDGHATMKRAQIGYYDDDDDDDEEDEDRRTLKKSRTSGGARRRKMKSTKKRVSRRKKSIRCGRSKKGKSKSKCAKRKHKTRFSKRKQN